MIDKIKGKKIAIWVAFNLNTSIRKIEGIVDTCSTLGGENFILLEDGTMINVKYVQIIEML